MARWDANGAKHVGPVFYNFQFNHVRVVPVSVSVFHRLWLVLRSGWISAKICMYRGERANWVFDFAEIVSTTSCCNNYVRVNICFGESGSALHFWFIEWYLLFRQ